MEKKYLYRLLNSFFEKEYPRDVQDRFASWFIRENQTEEKDEVLEEIWDLLPQTIDISTFSELKKVNKQIHSTSHFGLFCRRLAVAAAILVLPLSGVFTTVWYYNSGNIGKEISIRECYVANGERKEILLPDGSTVWLNAGSVLLYPEIFSDTRTLYLSGEGYFVVAPDKDKPFIVKTNFIEVEALGTIFNINSYPDQYQTTTTLRTGKVRVNDKTGMSDPVILSPDEQLIYNHLDASFTKSIVDASRLSSWTEGYLVFQQETLENIFHSMERRYNVKINYKNNDSDFLNMTFTIRFRAEDTLEEALDILKQIGNNFRYKIKANDVYIQY